MTRDDRLRSPYRPVRPVSAPQDGPWSGMLACLPTGEMHVLVDTAALGPDWKGWEAAPDGHVLAPLDLVRRADGHDAALPVCAERVGDLLARRARTAPLAAGEAVTLGVSVLRGSAQLIGSADATGEWWLTEDGRPLAATDASDRSLLDSAGELLAELARASADPHAWADAMAAITAERPSAADIERAEHRLFELADPVPLLTVLPGARPARDAVAVGRGGDETSPARPRPAIWEAIARHVDADIADLVSRTTTALWRRARAQRTASRTPWLVGAAAAAAVLCIGLLWPSGETEVASASGAGTEGSATPTAGAPTPASTPAPSPTAAAGSPPADLEAVTGDLLDRRRTCAEDDGCLAAVVQDPSVSFGPGPVDLLPDERAIVLLDDFGGVAVLRVDAVAGDQRSQLVVIALSDDEWLLRDVHDVAQQP
ncbi:hypothetical protein [Microbacterium sulfonylureivorans]|uniref:hypothetical protein n=1 Tax=Microbacterium sulfonylureivorans TaxID=2486854 RepID=UPI000FD9C554|nr:hypothetical protein [Microbacterium sulfonylureivorans]